MRFDRISPVSAIRIAETRFVRTIEWFDFRPWYFCYCALFVREWRKGTRGLKRGEGENVSRFGLVRHAGAAFRGPVGGINLANDARDGKREAGERG